MAKYYLMMTLATLFWAGSFVAGKFAVKDMGPMEIAFIRFALASILFYPLIHKKKEKYPLKTHFGFLIVGTLVVFCYHYLFFSALQYTTAVSAALILAVNPITTMLIASIFFHTERLTTLKIIGTLISFFGVLIVITKGKLKYILGISWNPGDLMMIVAALCWSVSIIYSRKLLEKSRNLDLTFYSNIYGTLVYIPFLFSSGDIVHVFDASLFSWGCILYMTVFSTVIGFAFYYEALYKIGPSRTALMVNLVPIFAAVLSLIILGESITLPMLMGGLLVFLGIAFVLKNKIL